MEATHRGSRRAGQRPDRARADGVPASARRPLPGEARPPGRRGSSGRSSKQVPVPGISASAALCGLSLSPERPGPQVPHSAGGGAGPARSPATGIPWAQIPSGTCGPCPGQSHLRAVSSVVTEEAETPQCWPCRRLSPGQPAASRPGPAGPAGTSTRGGGGREKRGHVACGAADPRRAGRTRPRGRPRVAASALAPFQGQSGLCSERPQHVTQVPGWRGSRGCGPLAPHSSDSVREAAPACKQGSLHLTSAPYEPLCVLGERDVPRPVAAEPAPAKAAVFLKAYCAQRPGPEPAAVPGRCRAGKKHRFDGSSSRHLAPGQFTSIAERGREAPLPPASCGPRGGATG